MKTPQKILDAIAACPETVSISVMGEEHDFLFSVYGCELAAAAGHDVLPVLGAALGDLFGGPVQDLDVDALQADPSGTAARVMSGLSGLKTSALTALATAVWSGLLPMRRDLDLDVFKAVANPAEIGLAVFKSLKPMLRLASPAKPQDTNETPDVATKDGPGKLA